MAYEKKGHLRKFFISLGQFWETAPSSALSM